MKAYERQLKKEGWKKNNWQDRIVFTFHKWISDFGMNYLKPFVILLLLTNLITYLSLISDRNKEFFPWFSSILSLTLHHFIHFLCILGILILAKKLIRKRFMNTIWNSLESLLNTQTIISIFLLLISLDIFILSLPFVSNLWNYFDKFVEMLNIAKVFKDNSNNHFSGFKLIYTFYSILTATLIYQCILAIRRRVKR